MPCYYAGLVQQQSNHIFLFRQLPLPHMVKNKIESENIVNATPGDALPSTRPQQAVRKTMCRKIHPKRIILLSDNSLSDNSSCINLSPVPPTILHYYY